MESDYFDIFDIEPSFNVDQKLLKQRYFELSKQYHPDFNLHLSEEEQHEKMMQSSKINEALKVLVDDDLLMAYLLKEYGFHGEETKEVLPPEFLMEMMDLNEQVMEVEMSFSEKALAEATGILEKAMNEIQSKVDPYLTRDPRGLSKEEWLKLKEFHFKKRYLLRIRKKLNTLAHPKEK